ncbi:unnamed protein product [Nippostrongylus brasiliensis]|uniref:Transmembrane protein 144 (inferred by orthology to a human protein) n=1 Tax=Nippostrongylus brasiliensis TaxID=27835 RepID=A0A158QYP8_NIPBR|nr:hypothetical protein Q1695_006823 [Nippostrongylus brasiliensis]VDL72391.1 unnamed protein product [Nippostrongylus brasiliensis]
MTEQSFALGLASAIFATLLYGSCYVPVRWFEAGDGLYFQWLMCIGQLVVGVVVLAVYAWPPVYPLAMLGGLFFAIGNALTITIMDGIGMAVGSLLWNTVTCIVGWAVSRFGLFGSLMKVPYDNVMNIIGVVVVCVGGCFFATLKHHPMKVRPAPWQLSEMDNQSLDGKPEERPISTVRRIIATLLTVFVGFLYGNMMTPMNFMIMESETSGGSLTYTTFFFSFSLGALLTSTVIFVVYSLYRRNRPFINPELTVPSLLSGIMYGTATVFFFTANQHLDPIVAYPILAKAPGIVCSCWAILLFKEIKGRWDVLQLIAGVIATLVGITLITVSKIKF